MVRLYFNPRTAKKGNKDIWSLDRGTQDTEVFADVAVSLVNMLSDHNPKAVPGSNEPYAWLYSTNADFKIINKIAYIGLPAYIASLR